MSRIDFRIPDQKKEKLQAYCTVHTTTISKLLMDYIDILLSESKPTAEEKSSVSSKEYNYCVCGVDLNTLSMQDRLLHTECRKKSGFVDV